MDHMFGFLMAPIMVKLLVEVLNSFFRGSTTKLVLPWFPTVVEQVSRLEKAKIFFSINTSLV